MNFKIALSLVLLLAVRPVTAEIANTDSFNGFVKHMVKQHHFKEAELRKLFKAAEIQQPILEAMSKPAEAKPWFQYREIFMTEIRIAGGVQFWRDNEVALRAVERQYGVPAEIIIAIIGVETRYGAHTGKYRVIDALSTLGFAYPPRSEFFLKELENFLLLSREEHVDPLQPMGSYAGAMGLPQFMPSSFRTYAADFDGDRKRDIWKNSGDAIASVANYFVQNQWRAGAPVAFPVTATGEAYKQALSKGVKPDTTVSQLRTLQLGIPSQLANSEPVKLLAYQQPASEDLWIGLHNFYVITRYNHSPLYAMAVFQLSQAIADRKKSQFSPA
jgi:membrane-bound lytic murein transglycosylase B